MGGLMARLIQLATIVLLHAWLIVLPTIGLMYLFGLLK
jgi:hypothetical protein